MEQQCRYQRDHYFGHYSFARYGSLARPIRVKNISSGERADDRKPELTALPALPSLRSLWLFSVSSVLNPERLNAEVTEELKGSQRVQETIFRLRLLL